MRLNSTSGRCTSTVHCPNSLTGDKHEESTCCWVGESEREHAVFTGHFLSLHDNSCLSGSARTGVGAHAHAYEAKIRPLLGRVTTGQKTGRQCETRERGIIKQFAADPLFELTGWAGATKMERKRLKSNHLHPPLSHRCQVQEQVHSLGVG